MRKAPCDSDLSQHWGSTKARRQLWPWQFVHHGSDISGYYISYTMLHCAMHLQRTFGRYPSVETDLLSVTWSLV